MNREAFMHPASAGDMTFTVNEASLASVCV